MDSNTTAINNNPNQREVIGQENADKNNVQNSLNEHTFNEQANQDAGVAATGAAAASEPAG